MSSYLKPLDTILEFREKVAQNTVQWRKPEEDADCERKFLTTEIPCELQGEFSHLKRRGEISRAWYYYSNQGPSYLKLEFADRSKIYLEGGMFTAWKKTRENIRFIAWKKTRANIDVLISRLEKIESHDGKGFIYLFAKKETGGKLKYLSEKELVVKLPSKTDP
ncbi:hypothetical protein EHQ12_13270 [Leptospira gomenensis]|uniref:Uncharacterized protein n=1 Tax=Leptospira gomenensis TaxID=2484974 RepID=A0A5F1YQR6_9LEPT|nr:hypothetical protein [Leptospira gomenensis]TGK28108.1 hypothetical protein EHQ17_18695 [Leptospira gomenensis]TGK37036.1 hypothetical protein EHQ12_13270 [Leptospira gomenensis]TGK45672.1 hypothetical protein EHQ07_08280 [Leptospira gomenensis]TGK59611.1 hypothetical protein EHQ13_12490 [Leptospira gomenensis]